MTAAELPSFNVLLRRLRLAAGLTQEALAERAGISAKAISDLERNPTRSPRLETVHLLAEALRLDPEGRTNLLAAARADHTLPTPEPIRGSWPRPLTPLFGRAGVAEAVAELLRRTGRTEGARLVTLTGIGGVGKTRLAIAAAELAADTFPDGLIFVDLAPLRDPALVLPAIASLLGIDERDKLPLSERLVTALRPRHLLLVLDNIEHLLPAREAILALLQTCPRLVVLATSRMPLRVRGEREYRVAPLEVPAASPTMEALLRSPSVALFWDRARAAGAEWPEATENVVAVAEICRRLDGLPLAIELAASWARLLPPAALVGRLERRLSLLVGGPHDLPARQRTMRDAIAWSYDLLAPDEQRLFRRLAVFVGGSTPAAATSIAGEGVEETAVLTGLAGLVDRSLLRPSTVNDLDDTQPRLMMLETLREFGLELLEQAGEAEDTHRAHTAYYVGLAEAAASEFHGPAEMTWGSRLASEHDNLRAALGWSLAQRDAGAALRLAGALWPFWSAHGYLNEGRRWLRNALVLAEATHTADDDAYAKALIGAAHLAIDHGAYDEAEGWCTPAVTLARARGRSRELVAALNAAGRLARGRGNYPEATRCHDEALALAEAWGNHVDRAVALTGLGYAALFSGDVARGTRLCEQSLALYRAAGDRRGLATALIGLAAAVSHAGAFAQSERFAAEALDLFRALGDTGQMAEALWVVGVSAMSQGQLDRAIPVHEEILALRRGRGDERGAIQPRDALGQIALQQGDHEQARVLLDESLSILARYDDPWARAMCLTSLGHVELAAGDVKQAYARFAEATPVFQAIGNPLYVPWVLEGLAGVAAARDAWDLAARLCGARDALHASLGLGMPPVNPAAYTRTVTRCRGTLSEDAFVVAHAAGGQMSPEQALAEVETLVSGVARR
jgi:predicted ATPase/DNA-binding XRE family transcriptional regulator